MPLSGHKLGPYEILSPLGKGGMGEVWRARDSRLGRDVAIKVADHRFSDRFEREARAIAALNHPNICTLYDVGPNYLVMEVVEGPTLAERIRRGPIPLDDALALAKQIASALDAAHEKGIVHRDLKPANIKIRPDGSVKVLDFGLAKCEPNPSAVTPDSPTMLTSTVGMIAGTAGYMSPEQARGSDVDKRTDIWAFAVVLFEMVTGKRLFGGATVSDSLAAIIKVDPDLTEAPPKIRRLLASCLEKDARNRLRDIGDWARLLDSAPSAATQSKRAVVLPWAIAAVAILAATGLGVVAWNHFAEQPQALRLTLATQNAEMSGYAARPAISPDGRRVAFATQVDGKEGLWLRDLDAVTARFLPGTEGAGSWFWSPDSRRIAFFANEKLQKIDITGGPPVTLCDEANGIGGTWGERHRIVYSRYAGGLFLVADSGGTPTPLTTLDTAKSEIVHRAPWFLPDGRHFLYTARMSDLAKSVIYVDSIDARPGSQTRREILSVRSNAIYVPRTGGGPMSSAKDGYLLFMRGNTLMAQPFDGASARITGDAVPVAEQVDYFRGIAQGEFSASTNGILVYTTGATEPASMQLTWFDRSGKPGATVGNPAQFAWAVLSPDGSTIATDRLGASNISDIWVQDLARNAASRLTFGPPTNENPVWSPDGTRIAFRHPLVEIWQKAANGVGKEELLYRDPFNRTILTKDWSPDGRYLVISVVDPKAGVELEAVPLFGDRKPIVYSNAGSNNEMRARLSPDAHLLAYTSNESGPKEVYVQTFPAPSGKWQITTAGGDWPTWSRDGRELYFLSRDNKMMAVDVKTNGGQFEAGVPRALFPVPGQNQFDVGKDGRFLIHVPQTQTTSRVAINVVVNWQSALKR